MILAIVFSIHSSHVKGHGLKPHPWTSHDWQPIDCSTNKLNRRSFKLSDLTKRNSLLFKSFLKTFRPTNPLGATDHPHLLVLVNASLCQRVTLPQSLSFSWREQPHHPPYFRSHQARPGHLQRTQHDKRMSHYGLRWVRLWRRLVPTRVWHPPHPYHPLPGGWWLA